MASQCAKHSVLHCFRIVFSCCLLFHSFLNTKLVLAQAPVYACDVANNPGLANFAFCNKSLDVKSRVYDLVKRMTLQEKIANLGNGAAGATRLGVPKYQWWSEALHGVSYVGPGVHFTNSVPAATSFPQVILTAASFNESLFETIGKVLF